MKKITVLIAIIFPAVMLAQSVSINSDATAPHNSAMLDIKSDSKGLLMPRLTSSQRTSIAGPAIGLTVFDINTYSYWMYRGDLNGGWAEMQHNFQNYWDASGNNIFNKNNGNIGIGTNSPTQKLAINATNPSIDFMNAGASKGYLQANGNDMRLGTYANNTTGNLVFNTKSVDRMWIDETGKVGIGTSTPGTALSLNGINPTFQLRNNNVDKGFLQLSSDDLKIGINGTNSIGRLIVRSDATDRVWFHNNGKVSMGIDSASSTQLTIGNNSGTAGISLFNANEKTFSISSYSGNAWLETTGNSPDQLILKAGSGASLHLKNNGQATIGIATAANNYRLTVLGKIMCADITTSLVYNWPDYVFADDYVLKPLSEVKKFISKNKHLPNIPAAAQMEKEGIQLGDMSKRMIEKIEELTLYIINMQEQIDAIKKNK